MEEKNIMFVMLRLVIEENYKLNFKIVLRFIPTRKVKHIAMYEVFLYFFVYCLLPSGYLRRL